MESAKIGPALIPYIIYSHTYISQMNVLLDSASAYWLIAAAILLHKSESHNIPEQYVQLLQPSVAH